MIYYTELPKIEYGVGVLFDTPEEIKGIIKNMLKEADFEDRYLFIPNMTVEQFREYYKCVMNKCDELNELFVHEDGINTAVAFPKMMFVCHNLESCYLMESYLNKITDPEKLAKSELAYHSTDHIVMTLDISAPL